MAAEEARTQDRRRALRVAEGSAAVGVAVALPGATAVWNLEGRGRTMRGSGVVGGAATQSRSWAELLRSILERDRHTLGLSVQLDLTMRQLLALYLLVEAPRRVGELARDPTSPPHRPAAWWTGWWRRGWWSGSTAPPTAAWWSASSPPRAAGSKNGSSSWGACAWRVLSWMSAEDLLMVQLALGLLVAVAREVVAERRAS